jgi:hypothetical protein
VEARGAKVIAGLDVLREAGAYRTLLTRTLRVGVSDGRLALSFTPTTGEALVSTITITKE